MTIIAATLCTILTFTGTATDDYLLWTNVASADVAGIRVYLNGAVIASLPPASTMYPLANLGGLACVAPFDAADNEAEAACFQWDAEVGIFAEFGPCALGCSPLPGGFGELEPGCCTAPLTVED